MQNEFGNLDNFKHTIKFFNSQSENVKNILNINLFYCQMKSSVWKNFLCC